MSSKRSAQSELTDRNWDEDEQPEERGSFSKANETEIARRVIKVGKRRIENNTSSSPGGGLFSGFTGFNAKKDDVSSPSPLSLLSSASSTLNNSLTTNQNKMTHETSTTGFSSFATTAITSSSSASSTFSFPKTTSTNGDVGKMVSFSQLVSEKNNNVSPLTQTDASDNSKKIKFGQGVGGDDSVKSSLDDLKESSKQFELERRSQVFQQKLASLNKSVVSWLTSHVEKNAVVDLSPVFNDYQKHLKKIDDEYQEAVKELQSVSSNKSSDNGVIGKKDEVIDGNKTESDNENKMSPNNKSLFAFLNQKKVDTSTTDEKNNATTTKPFIFGASKSSPIVPLSSVSSAVEPGQSKKTDEEQIVPMKNGADAANVTTSIFGKTTAASTNLSISKTSEETASTESKAATSIFASLAAAQGPKQAASLSNLFAPINNESSIGGIKTDLSGGFKFSTASAATTNAPASFSSLFKTPAGGDGNIVAPAFGTAQPLMSSIFPSASSTDSVKSLADSEATEAEASEEPPKNEFKEVEEPGSYFSVRCKLFYKKNDSWQSKGVGLLHFKSVDNDKTQLVLRADTNLGNIILNIILDVDAPVKKSGKNVISMITIANPPVEEKCPQCGKNYPNAQESNKCENECTPKPTPLMFKVKTEEDCDKLMEKLKNPKPDN